MTSGRPPAVAPRFAAIVLAAGSARRFGSDKLSAPFAGRPLVHHAIAAARAAPVEKVFVIAAPGLAPGDWQGAPPVEVLRLASPALSASLKAGIAAAAGFDGAFVFLGDMPLVPHGLAAELAAAIAGRFAALPRQGGKPGHPVLLSAAAFPAIAALEGDQGAGGLLKARGDLAFVDCTVEGIHLDVDRPDDLDRLRDKA